MGNVEFDYLIVGAGIVGANVFSALARTGHSVALVDKAYDVATGASKANSGLVHAGFDPIPGTNKARLNRIGNIMYPGEAKRLGLKIKRTGAYVVGNDKTALEELYKRGHENLIDGLELLDEKALHSKIKNLSPDIKYGLFAKNAYIVSPYMFTICLTEEGIVNGGQVLLGYQIKSVKREKDGYVLTNGKTSIKTKFIINAAGAGYNDVAKLIGAEEYPLEFRRGEYYVLDSSEKDLVAATVFPLPTQKGKGVLVTPTIDGNILVGPNSEISDTCTKTTKFGLDDIKNKAETLISGINFRKTIRIFSGIRTISGTDFIIEKSKTQPNVINIAGICSPGLSSAPAIALDVLKMLNLEPNYKKAKQIKPYFVMNDLSEVEQNNMIKQDPRYGKIVCKCENVSEGEIVEALHRPLKVYSTDGIKRRTRAGMGRCQSGFCLNRVVELIAKENGISLFDVVKENEGSNILLSNVKEARK